MQLGGMLVWMDDGLTCEECPAVWDPSEATRWRAYLTERDPVRLIRYCPECGQREFGAVTSSDVGPEPLWRPESRLA